MIQPIRQGQREKRDEHHRQPHADRERDDDALAIVPIAMKRGRAREQRDMTAINATMTMALIWGRKWGAEL